MTAWKEIQTVEEWDDALRQTDTRPLLLLKHSTACPISAEALREYEAYLTNERKEDVNYLLVKVIESREVSNKIADDLGIKHESPQIIFVKDRKAVWNASHWDVTQTAIRNTLN